MTLLCRYRSSDFHEHRLSHFRYRISQYRQCFHIAELMQIPEVKIIKLCVHTAPCKKRICDGISHGILQSHFKIQLIVTIQKASIHPVLQIRHYIPVIIIRNTMCQLHKPVPERSVFIRFSIYVFQSVKNRLFIPFSDLPYVREPSHIPSGMHI